NFLLLLNAHHEMIHFTLPNFDSGTHWQAIFDTHYAVERTPEPVFVAGDDYPLKARSLVLLIEIKKDQA
ncbi:MAG: hypothetical protein ABI656_13480, partial [bacterium]